MTQDEVFKALHTGGAFSLPYLIELTHPEWGTLRFINNTINMVYDGNTYQASAFKYTAPQVAGGVLKNGTLEISAAENSIIDLIDASDELLTVKAVGVLNKDGTITPFKMYRHQYGTATTDGDMKVTITFTNDDRMGMNFPPYVFDSDNNRGNA